MPLNILPRRVAFAENRMPVEASKYHQSDVDGPSPTEAKIVLKREKSQALEVWFV